jgi:hypothetical protein
MHCGIVEVKLLLFQSDFGLGRRLGAEALKTHGEKLVVGDGCPIPDFKIIQQLFNNNAGG